VSKGRRIAHNLKLPPRPLPQPIPAPKRWGSLFCTVCAYARQPAGKPCKLCGRTDAPERKP
jgi:hypothetical protein